MGPLLLNKSGSVTGLEKEIRLPISIDNLDEPNTSKSTAKIKKPKKFQNPAEMPTTSASKRSSEKLKVGSKSPTKLLSSASSRNMKVDIASNFSDKFRTMNDNKSPLKVKTDQLSVDDNLSSSEIEEKMKRLPHWKYKASFEGYINELQTVTQEVKEDLMKLYSKKEYVKLYKFL